MKKNVKGNILIGIIATYIIGVVLELAGCPVLPDQSLIPTAIINSNLGGSLGNVAFKFGEASGVFTGVRAFIDFVGSLSRSITIDGYYFVNKVLRF